VFFLTTEVRVGHNILIQISCKQIFDLSRDSNLVWADRREFSPAAQQVICGKILVFIDTGAPGVHIGVGFFLAGIVGDPLGNVIVSFGTENFAP
jgi:hypothetical protein